MTPLSHTPPTDDFAPSMRRGGTPDMVASSEMLTVLAVGLMNLRLRLQAARDAKNEAKTLAESNSQAAPSLESRPSEMVVAGCWYFDDESLQADPLVQKNVA